MRRNVAQTNPPALGLPQKGPLNLALSLILAITLSLGGFAVTLSTPAVARAETTEIDAEPDELQQELERTAAAYDEAVAHAAELEQQATENEERLRQIESDLPGQQERGAHAMRVLYLLQQDAPNLITLILDSSSFSDLLATMEYIDYIQRSNMAEIEQLQALRDELSTTQTAIVEARDQAYDERQQAEEALAAAQAAREEAQRRAQEEARAQAEAAARAAEEQAAKEAEQAAQAEQAAKEQEAANQETSEQPSQSESTPQSSTTVQVPTPDNADWSTDKTTFVAEWSSRIDAYLAGSPLAGQGTVFAEAAWDYGVDPRWSPAISNTESTKGAYCFHPHNAWGWGSVSWDSWDEAIRAHVRGLARGYGYTISVEAAKKYCPPNWEHWYNATLAQMNMI